MSYISKPVRDTSGKRRVDLTPDEVRQRIRARLEDQKARVLALDTQGDVHRRVIA